MNTINNKRPISKPLSTKRCQFATHLVQLKQLNLSLHLCLSNMLDWVWKEPRPGMLSPWHSHMNSWSLPSTWPVRWYS